MHSQLILRSFRSFELPDDNLAYGAVFACATASDTFALYKLTNASMESPFNLDLKVQRRKAGLSQQDVAHLIGAHPSKVSQLESGRKLPTLQELAALSVIFGKSFEECLYYFMQEARSAIAKRLPTMPQAPKRWLSSFNRQRTIDDLADQISDSEQTA